MNINTLQTPDPAVVAQCKANLLASVPSVDETSFLFSSSVGRYLYFYLWVKYGSYLAQIWFIFEVNMVRI